MKLIQLREFYALSLRYLPWSGFVLRGLHHGLILLDLERLCLGPGVAVYLLRGRPLIT